MSVIFFVYKNQFCTFKNAINQSITIQFFQTPFINYTADNPHVGDDLL